MNQSTGDLSLWFKSIDYAVQGLIGVYVDDRLVAGNKNLKKHTEKPENNMNQETNIR